MEQTTKYNRYSPSRLYAWAVPVYFGISLSASLSAAQGLAGWWKFDEGSGMLVSDSSGTGNHGALQGNCAFTQDGLSGASVEFQCQDGAVAVNHSPALEPPTGTIQAWVYLPVMQNSDVLVKTSNLLQRTKLSNGVYASVYGIRIHADGRVEGLILNDDPATPGAPWRFAYAPPASISPGQWHHLALRWNGSSLAVFVNGLLKGRTPYLPIPGAGLSYGGNSQLLMGAATHWSDETSHEFIGKIDEVLFYNYARSDAEMLHDYQQRGGSNSR